MVTPLSLALDVTALVLAAAAAACAWRSCRWLARGAAARHDVFAGRTDPPLVSLLVPARDEERHVAGCVASLLAQTYPRCEVLVLDDGSRDATARLARNAIERSSGRVPARVLGGRPLEPGWGGKGFACHQLADAARGDWLFFLDADTRLAPDAVARALAAAEHAGVALASFLPRYGGEHWTNRLVVPWLYFFLTALVPLPEVTRLRHPRLAVANGQAILVRRDAYERAGGHAAIRDHIVEDVSLAIQAKRAGVRIALLDGHAFLGCEMYDGTRALAAGFAKSFHSAARRYPLQWAALLTLLVLIGVRPWLGIAWPEPARGAALAPLTLLLVGGTFAALLVRFRQSLVALVVWPLALAWLVAIALQGGVSGLLGRQLTWRGRAVGGEAPS